MTTNAFYCSNWMVGCISNYGRGVQYEKWIESSFSNFPNSSFTIASKDISLSAQVKKKITSYPSYLSRLQLASAIRTAALTSRDGILRDQGIPNVKNRKRESYYQLIKGCWREKFVIRYVTDVLRTQSRFVKFVRGVEASGQTTSVSNLITNNVKQGIVWVYVVVDFICIGFVDLRRTRSKRELNSNTTSRLQPYCHGWDLTVYI